MTTHLDGNESQLKEIVVSAGLISFQLYREPVAPPLEPAPVDYYALLQKERNGMLGMLFGTVWRKTTGSGQASVM